VGKITPTQSLLRSTLWRKVTGNVDKLVNWAGWAFGCNCFCESGWEFTVASARPLPVTYRISPVGSLIMFASVGQIAEPQQSRALSIAWGDFVTKPSSNVNKAVTNCR
jgi:hypothetical protein